MQDDLEKMIRELNDKQQIAEVIMRWCRGADRGDREMLDSVYHEGATAHVAPFSGLFADMANGVASLAATENFTHYIGNQLIELDGDVAYAETYLLSTRWYTEDGKQMSRTRCGRWCDRFERRNGEWRITNRVLADHWGRIDEVEPFVPTNPAPAATRDKNDPVYTIRQLGR